MTHATARLVWPDQHYKDSYIAALMEFRDADDLFFSRRQLYQSYDVQKLDKDFDNLVLKPFSDAAAGIGQPAGFLPQSEYWLVEGENYIGAIHIRHGLTPFLETEGGNLGYEIRPSKRGQGYAKMAAEFGLYKAAELGLDKVIITCNAMNPPSVYVAKNLAAKRGEELEPYVTENERIIRRFLFKLKKV